MKTLAILTLTMLCAGCAYRGTKTPMQPGEKVIFLTPERANHFRHDSGNDAVNTNRVVKITRPTILITP